MARGRPQTSPLCTWSCVPLGNTRAERRGARMKKRLSGLRGGKRRNTSGRTVAPPDVQIRQAQQKASAKRQAEQTKLQEERARESHAGDAAADAALQRAVAALHCTEEVDSEPQQGRAFARPSARARGQGRAPEKQTELLDMSSWCGSHIAGTTVLHSMNTIATAVHHAVLFGGALVLSENGTGPPRVLQEDARSFANDLSVQEFLKQINSDARACLKAGGWSGQGEEVASGELNSVVKYSPTAFAGETRRALGIPQGTAFAVRVARDGISTGSGCEFMPRSVAVQELSIAAFAAVNGVGVPLYAACVHPERVALGGQHALVGTTMIMALAEDDAGSAFDVAGVIALLQRASQLGLLLFDVKPGNVLRIRPEGSAVHEYKLADFDTAFSAVCTNEDIEDWRALMLMHLLLFTAHVANSFPPFRAGIAHAWLIGMRKTIGALCAALGLKPDAAVGAHALSRWLLAARATAVRTEPVARALEGSLARWRALNVVCTHYFYKPKVHGKTPQLPSAQWDGWMLSSATLSREADTFGTSVLGRLIAFVDWWLQSASSGR